MIALAILAEMERAGLCTVDKDGFWEEIPLVNGKATEGLWITTRGASLSRDQAPHQTFDISARYNDPKGKIKTERKLAEISDWLMDTASSLCIASCEPYATERYKVLRITSTDAPSQSGIDENGRIVKTISGEIYYTREDA